MRFLKFLSSDWALQSKYFFSVPRFCLAPMGYWPEHGYNVCTIVNFVILAIGVVTELLAGFTFLQHNNLAKALETLCPAGTSTVTLLKMFLIHYFRKDLKYVLAKLRSMLDAKIEAYDKHDVYFFKNELRKAEVSKWQHVRSSLMKRRILSQHSVLAARLNFMAFSAGFFTCTTYNLKPILIALLLWFQGKAVLWSTPFNMTMPDILLRPPLFPITYIFIAYTGYVTVFMFSGCDAFYFEFCTHIAALFRLLHGDVCSLFRQFDNHFVLNAAESKFMAAHLIGIVKRHNEIIELTNFFRQRYAIITLAHFVSAAIVIGLSIIDMLTYSGIGMLIYVTYTIAALCQLLIYCYGGTLVAENSADLATVVGNCNWHICRPQERRIILLIILRAQRPLSMAVPFFAPSLATFAAVCLKILQTSGSIIALASSFQ